MTDKETFRVFRKDACLGTIVECGFDYPRWSGRLEENDAFGQVAPLFRAMFDALVKGKIEKYNKVLEEAANLNLVVQRVGEDKIWPVFFRVLVPPGNFPGRYTPHRTGSVNRNILVSRRR